MARLSTGAVPDAELVGRLTDGVHDDGGWPAYWSNGTPSVEATCVRLRELDGLGLLGTAAARRAVRWLVSVQQPDGGWHEDPRLAGTAPSWVRPGDPAAGWYLTASAALCVVRAGSGATPPDTAVRAAGRLAGEVSEAGTLPSFPATHWLTAALCWTLGDQDTAERLMDRFRWPDYPLTVADWSWYAVTLAGAGIPAEHPALRVGLDALTDTQSPDGSWPGADYRGPDVGVTLDALAAELTASGLADSELTGPGTADSELTASELAGSELTDPGAAGAASTGPVDPGPAGTEPPG